MGYTHYFSNKKDIPIKVMEKIVRDFNLIYAAYKNQIKIQYELDISSEPMICKDLIRFNGEGEQGYETFVFSRRAQSEFCKTGRKPYDLYAACLLIIIKHHTKSRTDISTDGDPDDNEWVAALNTCKKIGITDVQVIQNWDKEHRYRTCTLEII